MDSDLIKKQTDEDNCKDLSVTLNIHRLACATASISLHVPMLVELNIYIFSLTFGLACLCKKSYVFLGQLWLGGNHWGSWGM